MQRYQQQDRELIDYELFELEGVKPHPQDGLFRGPPLESDRYIACIGAAQTFGRFARRPFATLLRDRLGIATLNLGSGGAGPAFHNSNPRLLEYINRARLTIVQVLSGRSESNSLFRIKYYGAWGIRAEDGAEMSAEEFFADLLVRRPEAVRRVVAETRRNYVLSMIKLLNDIEVPTILFWFSTRSPDYAEEYAAPVWQLFGEFPQLVNRPMVDEIRAWADGYVECVSDRGLPQRLTDEAGNERTVATSVGPGKEVRTSWNAYYPSPEMHVDAADALELACRRLLFPDTAGYLDVRLDCADTRHAPGDPYERPEASPAWRPAPPPAR